MHLLRTIIIQVVSAGCLGITLPSLPSSCSYGHCMDRGGGGGTRTTVKRPGRETGRRPHWQLLLQDSVFQTLAKYTGFTDSLDERIERDRVLWGLVHSARFLRKAIDVDEEARAGVLVDGTKDSGGYEFHQLNGEAWAACGQHCAAGLPLLAVWRVEALGPSQLVVRVKSPFGRMQEDLYSYTGKGGLERITPQAPTAPAAASYRAPAYYIPKGYYLTTQQLSPYQSTTTPYSKILEEFGSTQYDGFLPSLGPGSTILTTHPSTAQHHHHHSQAHSFTYTTPTHHYQYTTPAAHQYTTKLQLNNFKPSTELVEYSETDPWYHQPEYYSTASPGAGQSANSFQYYTRVRHEEDQGNQQGPRYPGSINEQLEELEQQGTADAEPEPTLEPSTTTSTTPKPTRLPKHRYKPRYPSRIKTVKRPIVRPGEKPKPSQVVVRRTKWGERLRSTASPTETKQESASSQQDTKVQPADQGVTVGSSIRVQQAEKTNIGIDHVTARAPEDVVSLLTTVGLQEESTLAPEPPDPPAKHDQTGAASESNPQSRNRLVVSRVSKSVSMSVSRG